MDYELLIIGGGAAGLAAAVTAASYGMQRIAILERAARVGRKILATGNGRCNLSHTSITAAAYSGSCPTDEVLADFGDASDFFLNLGLHCRTDAAGRMYPYTMAASTVLDALRFACAKHGIEEICDAQVTALAPCKSGWRVRTKDNTYTADAVLFAAGGYAAPQLGTDGSAWALLRQLGIPLSPPRPILCPILSEEKLLRPLKGLRVKAKASLLQKHRCLYAEEGEVQFTQQALSGICIFNMTRFLQPDSRTPYRIQLDLLPEEGTEETLSRLFAFQAVRGEGDLETLLSGILQKPLARLVLQQCRLVPTAASAGLDYQECRQIAEMLHNLIFPVMGLPDWKQAQATAGGVCGTALLPTLEVRQLPGLFVAGEAMDVHSLCGGYHLHWAWASGCYAAKQIVKRRNQG